MPGRAPDRRAAPVRRVVDRPAREPLVDLPRRTPTSAASSTGPSSPGSVVRSNSCSVPSDRRISFRPPSTIACPDFSHGSTNTSGWTLWTVSISRASGVARWVTGGAGAPFSRSFAEIPDRNRTPASRLNVANRSIVLTGRSIRAGGSDGAWITSGTWTSESHNANRWLNRW